MTDGLRVLAPPPPGAEGILSGEALAFVEKLHRQFQPTRQAFLKARDERQEAVEILDGLIEKQFTEFLTLLAYPYLE